MGYSKSPSASSSDIGSQRNLQSSQTCLSGEKAGQESDKHLTIAGKIKKALKSKLFFFSFDLHIKYTFDEKKKFILFHTHS